MVKSYMALVVDKLRRDIEILKRFAREIGRFSDVDRRDLIITNRLRMVHSYH